MGGIFQNLAYYVLYLHFMFCFLLHPSDKYIHYFILIIIVEYSVLQLFDVNFLHILNSSNMLGVNAAG